MHWFMGWTVLAVLVLFSMQLPEKVNRMTTIASDEAKAAAEGSIQRQHSELATLEADIAEIKKLAPKRAQRIEKLSQRNEKVKEEHSTIIDDLIPLRNEISLLGTCLERLYAMREQTLTDQKQLGIQREKENTVIAKLQLKAKSTQ